MRRPTLAPTARRRLGWALRLGEVRRASAGLVGCRRVVPPRVDAPQAGRCAAEPMPHDRVMRTPWGGQARGSSTVTHCVESWASALACRGWPLPKPKLGPMGRCVLSRVHATAKKLHNFRVASGKKLHHYRRVACATFGKNPHQLRRVLNTERASDEDSLPEAWQEPSRSSPEEAKEVAMPLP